MAFHDVQFPTDLSFGATGGPERRTEIVTLNSGYEERNTPWAHARRRYDAGVAMRTLDDLEQVIEFFEARSGPLHAFRWRDWSDYKSCKASLEPAFDDQVVGVGDNVTTAFQLTKTYRSGDQAYARDIVKPVENTVKIGVGGVEKFEGADYSVNTATGIVTLFDPPSEAADVTAGFVFDVPVRFASDALEINVAHFSAGEIPSVPVIEVRV